MLNDPLTGIENAPSKRRFNVVMGPPPAGILWARIVWQETQEIQLRICRVVDSILITCR